MIQVHSAGDLFAVTFDDVVKAVKRLEHGKQYGESLASPDFLILLINLCTYI
jgi:hypothetical protein